MNVKSDDYKHSRILVVDDDVLNVKLIEAYLIPEEYDILTAYDGEEALKKVEEESVDLILLDIMLPKINGYEVCQQLKAREDLRLIPIIMITALDEREDKIKGIETGADDFLTKPVDKGELLARIKSLLRVKYLNEQLENVEAVLFFLANLIEAKDPYTKDHTKRVAKYAERLAKEAGLSLEQQNLLRKAGTLHDIGKIGVPEAILNKPGPLAEEEFNRMKEHSVLGEKICNPLKSMSCIVNIIRHHHERFDGNGYPDGLKGEEIPIGARIMAIVDSFDAMILDRPYRKKMAREKAIEILKEEAGKQWDPKLVEIFIKKIDTMVS